MRKLFVIFAAVAMCPQGGTEFMWSFYSGQVREVLARHGWAAPSYHPEFLMINAQEIVRPCE